MNVWFPSGTSFYKFTIGEGQVSPYPFFFFNDTATTEIYTLSLHDALPISRERRKGRCGAGCTRYSYQPGYRRCRTRDRKSTRLNSSHSQISYAVFCLKKKKRRSPPRQVHARYPRPPPSTRRPSRLRG